MSAVLYVGEPNGASLTALAAVFETDAAVTLQSLDLAAGARHRLSHEAPEIAYSVEGEGPVLIVGDTAMSDGVFIARYLDEIVGGGVLLPREPYARWQAMAWCRWVDERIAPVAAYLGTAAHPPAAVPDGIVSSDLAQRWRDAVAGTIDEARHADSRIKIGQGTDRIETQLADGRDWLMERFGICDLESYAWLAGMTALVPQAFHDRPRTAAWLARVKARPSVAAALARATLPDPETHWVPGPEINRWG